MRDIWISLSFLALVSQTHAALPIYVCIYNSMAYRHVRLCSVVQERACLLSLAPHQLPSCACL